MISKNTKLQAIFYHKSFVSSAVLILVSSMHAQAGPGGGQVTSGAAQITQSGNVTNITQSSTNASLVWKSFNVSPTETVNFLQPSASSVAVNKITDSNASQILGNINSNGQIFLINPSGILFGNGAQVNVGGLVASTLDLNSSLSVNTKVFTDSNPNKTYPTGVTNLGTLTSTGTSVKGGYIALLGNTVSNLGTINSPQGTVALGSGSSVTLTMQNSNLLSMQIDQNILKSLTENGGVIHASGGLVLLSSGAKDALVASVVNNTGLIEARTVSNQSGNIVLLGGMTAGTVNVGGTLDASAPHSGNGGLIETSASSVNVSSAAIITSESLNGKNGTWLIDPSAYTIAPTGGNMTGAALSASLSLNNVTIESTSGTNTNLGDITVNDSVNWNSNKTLTLSADNNININQSITSTNASAGLALLYGQGAISADNYAVINIKAPVNLASAQSFSTNLGSDGTPKVFRVITSLGAAGSTSSNDLQGISGNLAINYALGNDIDAKPTANWNAQTGFVPIAGFAGTLDGLGHTISNLVINLPGTASVGLIGTAGATAVVQNLGLLGGYTIGGAGTGALLGSGGTAQVINSFATGNVNGAASTGGLVGTMTSGNIINSYSTGNVKNGVAASVGGLLGSGTSGNVSNSFASGAVTGGAGAGGLVGAITTGNITNSYATGAVSGGAGSGGLVGTITTGNISNTYSTGSVKGDAGTGGLVGVGTTGVITNSYATGLISGAGAGRGGLIGVTSAISVGSFWDTTGTAMSVSTGAGAIGMTTADMKAQANFSTSTLANKNLNPNWDMSNTWIVYEGQTLPMLRSFMTPLNITANNVSKTYDGMNFLGGSAVAYSSNYLPSNIKGTLTYKGNALGASDAGDYSIELNGLYSNQQGYLINYVPGTLTISKAPIGLLGTRVYDGTTELTANIFSLTGLVAGQKLSLNAEGIGKMSDKNANNLKSFSDTGTINLNDAPTGQIGKASNYTLEGGSKQVVIQAAPITISAPTSVKIYDGTTSVIEKAQVTTGAVFLSDALSPTGVVYNDKNVGNDNKMITANGVTVIDGNNGANYKITYLSTFNSTIEPAPLVVTALASNKTYDGNNNAQVSFLDDRVKGDIVTVSLKPNNSTGSYISIGTPSNNLIQIVTGTTGAYFFDKNAETNKNVFVSGIVISGKDAGNYTANTDTQTKATISPKELTPVVSSGLAKVYDGLTTDQMSLVNSNNGVIAGDNVLITGTRNFADTNVGTTKPVTIKGIELTGGDAKNYSLTTHATDTFASITPKAIIITADGQTRAYDGTTNESVTFNIKGILTEDLDKVTVSGLATFANKSAGTGKTVTVTNIALDGVQKANYSISSTKLTTSATINPLAININAVGNKVYDGSTSDIVALSSDGILPGDTVSFLNKSALFSDKNVGNSKTLTISGISMTGKDAGNYLVSGNETTIANITPKGVTVSASGTNKIYDGTSDAKVTLSTGLGMIKGDDLLLSGTATFNNESASVAKVVTVKDISATGNDTNNYTLNNTVTKTFANITPKPITVKAIGSEKEYDGNLIAQVTLSSNDILPQDTSNMHLSAVSLMTNKNVGIGKTVNITNISATGSESSNYSVKNTTTTALFNVTPKEIGFDVIGKDKIYDGSSIDVVSISSKDIVMGDNVTFVSSSAGFADKNVNVVNGAVAPKVVSVSGIALMGKDATNYALRKNNAQTSATITPKGLTVIATGTNKVYDGKTDDLVKLSAGTEVIKGDSLGFTDTSAVLDTKNVGVGKIVTVKGITATGIDANNYMIANATATTKANVTPLPIFITAIGIDKPFDGTLTDTVNLSSLGFVTGDLVGLTNTSAKFSTNTVGINKAVTVTGINTTGPDAFNYSVMNKTITTFAAISAK